MSRSILLSESRLLQHPLAHEFFTAVISLLTAAHIRDWKTFSDILDEKNADELKSLAAHACGMLYASTLSEAETRGKDYLEFISELSLRGQSRLWNIDP